MAQEKGHSDDLCSPACFKLKTPLGRDVRLYCLSERERGNEEKKREGNNGQHSVCSKPRERIIIPDQMHKGCSVMRAGLLLCDGLVRQTMS